MFRNNAELTQSHLSSILAHSITTETNQLPDVRLLFQNNNIITFMQV